MRRPSGLQALLGFGERCAPQGGPLWTSICLASISQEGLWKQGFRDSAPGLPATRTQSLRAFAGLCKRRPAGRQPSLGCLPTSLEWIPSAARPQHVGAETEEEGP